MQAVLIGNIADSVVMGIKKVLPYAEEQILQSAVEAIVPKCGIVIEAQKDELKGNDELGTWLYNDIEIKVKE